MDDLDPSAATYFPCALAVCAAGLLLLLALWLSLRRGQRAGAKEVARAFLVSCTATFGGLILVALAHLPTLAFPPFSFRLICIPFWIFLSCGLLLILPGKLKLSLGALISTCLLLAVTLVIIRLPNWPHFSGGVYSHKHRVFDPLRGAVPVPLANVRARRYLGSRLLYDVGYHHDQFGRRRIPIKPNASHFLLSFGCSFTYGEGVDDDQNWPARLAQQKADWNVYNYAFGGWGPTQMLDLLKNRRLCDEVAEKRGQAVFLYLPSHIQRVIGSWSMVSTWGGSLSRYRLAKDRLERLGSFSGTQNPLTFLLCHTAGGVGLYNALGVDVPPEPSQQDYDLVAAIILESQQALDSQFGRCPLTVVFLTRLKEFPYLSQKLEPMGIRCAELAKMPESIPGDGHPTAQGQSDLAQGIAKILEQGP